MIRVAGDIVLREEDLDEVFILSTGPGGQKVNKTASAVQLWFDIDRSDLPEAVKERLRSLAGRRLDSRGRLLIAARRHRSREQNRRDARERLAQWVRRALVVPKPRRRSRGESAGAKRKRVETKRRRGSLKALRKAPDRSADA